MRAKLALSIFRYIRINNNEDNEKMGVQTRAGGKP